MADLTVVQLGALGTALGNAMPAAAAHNPVRKVEPLMTDTEEEWRIWRRHFNTIVTINNWGAQRARREIVASMQGEAAKMISHIPTRDAPPPAINGVAQPVAPFIELLDEYQKYFAPQVSLSHLKLSARNAVQKEDESISKWLARYSGLYTRAYPEVGDVPAWPDAIAGFINGLKWPKVAHEVRAKAPANLTLALTAALDAEANRYVGMNIEKSRGEVPNDPMKAKKKHVLQLEDAGPPQAAGGFPGSSERTITGKCHFCKEVGHFRRDCKAWTLAQKYVGNRDGGAGNGSHRGNNRGRGGFRGRGRGRGGGGGGARAPSANKLQMIQKQLQQMIQEASGSSDNAAKEGWSAAYPGTTDPSPPAGN